MAAVVSYMALLQVRSDDDSARRYITNHAQAANLARLETWIERSGDVIVLRALLYALQYADRYGLIDLSAVRQKTALQLESIAPDLDDPVFKEERRKTHAMARAEVRGDAILDRSKSRAQDDPRHAPRAPTRQKPSPVTLWTGRSSKRTPPR
ncbi:MAG: hypothetical protein ACOCU4_10125 [Alkalispirochaeta sp.]